MSDGSATMAADEDLVTVFLGRKIITMDSDNPVAEAIAVLRNRIVAVGSVSDVLAQIGDAPYVTNEDFSEAVILPGLIDQHLHPFLASTTLTTEVIAPEAWVLPRRVFAAAETSAQYDERLLHAHERLAAGEWLFSWGYHKLWHGALHRERLDALTGDRPTAIWQRSCHEWFLNTAAIEALELTPEKFAGHGPASDQLDFERGHFWENGWMQLLSRYLMPKFLTEERFRSGLSELVEYLHMNGVTAINEPGIAWAVEPWNLYQEILGAPDVPFSSTFLVDGRNQAVKKIGPDSVVGDANSQIARAPEGKVSLVAGQVKLFADGAIISQLMQMRDGYLDADGNVDPDHHGEWLMEPDALRTYFDPYWDAGWQIHIHVNGDLGLEVLLDIIEDAMKRHPRIDHRTVLVHFATSTDEQVERIARLGAIVSANPYYPIGFADKYRLVGLGPDRADSMARSGSVLRQNVPLSFHSDLPMGPSDPMAMASFAINRITNSGRVAAPDQRISVQQGLEAVTIGPAFSWRRENDLGSLEVGKIANMTVLAEDPFATDPRNLRKIRVLATVFEGVPAPVSQELQSVREEGAKASGESMHLAQNPLDLFGGLSTQTALQPLDAHAHAHDESGCGCEVAVFIAEHIRQHGLRRAS